MTRDGGADFYKASKFDAILICLILFLSLASIVWIGFHRTQQDSQSKMALIYEKDRLLERVNLDKDRIFSLLNGQMQIEVKKGKIRVFNSNCPQHICMNMGWIQYSGQAIVCVPNKIIIEIASKGSPLLDAVVY